MYADDLQVYIRCPLVELDGFSNKMSANAIRIMNPFHWLAILYINI